MLSETSELIRTSTSRVYGTQHAVEEESRGELLVQERRQEWVPRQGEGTGEYERGQRRGASHAHSTSLSTVTGPPPQPRGGSSGVPMDGVFQDSGFGPRSGYQVQTGYTVQPSHPRYESAQQHAQPPAQVHVHMRPPSQEQYQYKAVSALHATPGPGFQGRSEFQARPQPVVELQGQVRTTVPTNRVPPARTSTKRPRAPKRPRPATYTGIGIGASRGNLAESDDDSDDDEVIEWVPDWAGGAGASTSMSAGAGELGGTGGGAVHVTPAPGGRKCVFLLFHCRFLFPCGMM